MLSYFFPKYCLGAWLFKMVGASCFHGLWVFKIPKSLPWSSCLWIEPQKEFRVSSQMGILVFCCLVYIFYLFTFNKIF